MYSTYKVLLTTKCIQLIDYKKFALAALDPGKKAFILYITN